MPIEASPYSLNGAGGFARELLLAIRLSAVDLQVLALKPDNSYY